MERSNSEIYKTSKQNILFFFILNAGINDTEKKQEEMHISRLSVFVKASNNNDLWDVSL